MYGSALRRIEESRASLVASRLPPELEGLMQLPVIDRNPQVSILYVHNGRKDRATRLPASWIPTDAK